MQATKSFINIRMQRIAPLIFRRKYEWNTAVASATKQALNIAQFLVVKSTYENDVKSPYQMTYTQDQAK